MPDLSEDDFKVVAAIWRSDIDPVNAWELISEF
jgi:hypothetical protein